MLSDTTAGVELFKVEILIPAKKRKEFVNQKRTKRNVSADICIHRYNGLILFVGLNNL